MKDEKYSKSNYPLNKIVGQVTTTVTENQYFFYKAYNINKPPPKKKEVIFMSTVKPVLRGHFWDKEMVVF